MRVYVRFPHIKQNYNTSIKDIVWTFTNSTHSMRRTLLRLIVIIDVINKIIEIISQQPS